jgi:hypothetical protein
MSRRRLLNVYGEAIAQLGAFSSPKAFIVPILNDADMVKISLRMGN